MEIIDDKEVGEIWRKLGRCQRWINDPMCRHCVEKEALIRKLVEEEYLHQLSFNKKRHQENESVQGACMAKALGRYHIDPATWPKE